MYTESDLEGIKCHYHTNPASQEYLLKKSGNGINVSWDYPGSKGSSLYSTSHVLQYINNGTWIVLGIKETLIEIY